MIRTSPNTAFTALVRLLPIPVVGLWSLSASAANLIPDGTFDMDKGSWWGNASTTSDPPAEQVTEVVDGKVCVTMASGGKNPWDVALGRSDVPLVANKWYRYSFEASADVERTIKYKTGRGEAPWTDYFIKTITISPTPITVDTTFLNVREDPTAQIQFQIGKMAGKVCFDNVVVEEVPEPVLPPYATASKTGHMLKDYKALIKLGTAVDTPIFYSSPQHNAIVKNEFSMITPANSMKMNNIQPVKDKFDFADTDALQSWATTNGLEFRGHPLIWHTQVPNWLTDVQEETGAVFTKDQMLEVMYKHMDTVMEHYKDKITTWDVLNEALTDGPQDAGDPAKEFDYKRSVGAFGYRDTVWFKRIGVEFIDLAFKRARMNAPSAKLFYNEYNAEEMGNDKGDRMFNFIKDLKTRGVPIDGVGLQGHYYVNVDGVAERGPDMAKVKANMARYAELGLEVQITETDYRIYKPLTDAKSQMQATFYKDLLQVCIDAPNCTGFTVWGLSDVDSWVPSTFPDADYAHLYDKDLVAKAGYYGLTDVLAKYDTDGSPAGDDKKSGCAVQPANANGATGLATLFGALALSALVRRTRRQA